MNRLGATISCFVATFLTILALHCSSGFSPSKIVCTLSAVPSSCLALPKLSEPYTYLAHGRQTFVFESADKQTVIKFFNQNYFQKRWYHFIYFLPQWKQLLHDKLSLRQQFYLESYPLAAQEFPEETGILYLHLHSSSSLPSIHLIDPSGRPLTLDLNQVAFVIQKKAETYLPHIQKVSSEEGLVGLKREIDLWLSFCSKRIDRHISDYDHDIWNNVGVLNQQILFIDPGKFHQHSSPLDFKTRQLEWWKASHRLYKWLLTNNPEAATYLISKIHKLCALDGNAVLSDSA